MDFQVNLGQVGGDDRDRRPFTFGQNIGLADKVNRRVAVFDVNVDIHRFAQGFTAFGRQPLAEGDAGALAVMQALDTDLVVLRLDRQAAVSHAHEIAVFHARRHQWV